MSVELQSRMADDESGVGSDRIEQRAEEPYDGTPRIGPYDGYLVVAAGFIANTIVFGIGFTFGVFQDFYLSKDGPLHGQKVSQVSIIGSLATALTYMLTIFNGYLSRKLGVRHIMMIGSATMGIGLISASWARDTWQFALSQGITFGLGSSMTYMPPVVHAPPYFSAHRGIAMGIVFSGTGLGGLAMAPFTRWLISTVGWQWALRVLGMLAFGLTFPTSFMVKPYPYDADSSQQAPSIMVNMRVAKTWKFALHISGGLIQSAGYLIPLFFMSAYAQTLGFTYSQGATFIGVNNAVNALSKIVLGYFADRIGRLNMLVLCCFMSTVTVLALWLVPLRSTFLAFVVLYGIFSGPIIALLPICVVDLFGIQNYKSISSFLYFSRGVGNFLGSPIAGLFVTGTMENPTSYRSAILYNGALFVVNTLCFAGVRAIAGPERRP